MENSGEQFSILTAWYRRYVRGSASPTTRESSSIKYHVMEMNTLFIAEPPMVPLIHAQGIETSFVGICLGVFQEVLSPGSTEINNGDNFMLNFASGHTGNKSQMFEWFDENMPGQYAVDVRGVNEARGLAGFGDVFGELDLYETSVERFRGISKGVTSTTLLLPPI